MAKSAATALVHALAATRKTLLRNDAYVVQMLDGYTDGRPSWRRVFVERRGMIGKASADAAADELRKKYPHRKYRVRKHRRR